jgi:hypothetical protein
MRPLIAACVVVVVMAVGAAVILDQFVQKSVSVAFATSAVRT